MLKKALILGCLSVIGMNLSVSALSESKSVLTQESSLQAVAQNKLSKVELQKCIKEARQYIAKLRAMGYSNEKIRSIVAEQIGVCEGHITTQKMWVLLLSAVIISSAIGGTVMISAFAISIYLS